MHSAHALGPLSFSSEALQAFTARLNAAALPWGDLQGQEDPAHTALAFHAPTSEAVAQSILSGNFANRYLNNHINASTMQDTCTLSSLTCLFAAKPNMKRSFVWTNSQTAQILRKVVASPDCISKLRKSENITAPFNNSS